MNSTQQARPTASPSFWTRGRVITTALVFVLVAVVASSCNRTPEVDPDSRGAVGTRTGEGTTTTSAPANAGKNAPGEATTSTALSPDVLNTSLQLIDAKPATLAGYAGKVVIINFWATWCGPCRTEIPHFIELRNEYGAKGLEILGLTTEDPDADEDKVRAFAKAFKINYQLGWSNPQFASGLVTADAIPQTFVISRDGRLLETFLGFDPQRTPPRLRAVVEQALGQSSE